MPFSHTVCAQSSYDQGLSLYRAKRFSQASGYFTDAWKSDKNNLKAAYYAGYCLYSAGRRPEACAMLWQLVDCAPTSSEASSAKTMLQRIDPEYAHHKRNSIDVSTTASRPASSGGNSANGRTVETAQAIVDAIVHVSKPRGKLPAVTPQFVMKIKSLLLELPLPILRKLRASGAKVSIMPSVVEYDYRIQNTQPRGWSEGTSWANSPALTYGKEVVVSQYRVERGGDPVSTDSEVGVVRHEVGHALDHCLGNFSETEKFKHAWYLDSAEVPAEMRDKLAYNLQKDHGGPSETFAELFNSKFGGYTDSGRAGTAELVKQHFPRCKTLVEEVLANL